MRYSIISLNLWKEPFLPHNSEYPSKDMNGIKFGLSPFFYHLGLNQFMNSTLEIN